VATCLPACPLGIDIPGFIRLLREGDAAAALERIKKQNPFPAICGRICPAPCERSCVFYAEGSPIAIRELERFASDFGAVKPEKQAVPVGAKKIAVIGSGPAGMSAAYYLAKSNFGVTIFEAGHEPGGLLRYGVPEFRLPQKVLDDQFAQLKLLGVEVETDAVFGRNLMMDEIFMRGFAAILLATGAGLPRFNDLPGSSLGGVYYDMEFLSRLQITGKEDACHQGRQQMLSSAKTVVIGRGPSAFDAARLAVRLGSKTQVVFEGFEEQADVAAEILQQSREEDVEMHSMRALEIMGNEAGFVTGVKCHPLDIVEDEGGLRLQPSSEGPMVLEANTVVIANGHRPGGFLKQYLPQLKWNADGSLWTDIQTGMSSMEKVFGCGDVASGKGAVVDAIAGGRSAAQNIIQYLSL